MLLCPFCGNELKEKSAGGWNCQCEGCKIVNVCPIKKLGGDPLRKEFGVMA